jgi:outer membrane protein OmpA-like peptidoglycan-associated protein
MFVNQRFAHSNGSDGANVLATVTAGITYKFNARGFQRASDLIVVEDNTRYVQEIAKLEQMLEKADQKRSVLEMQLKNVKKELNEANSVEIPVPLMPNLAIFFEIGKADLTQKSIINLGYMADVIKQFPGKSFIIFASADKETGTPEFNMQLSQKRGEAVMNAMVEKFGVNPEQLRIVAVGSQEQKFDKAQLNRVVVIEDQE